MENNKVLQSRQHFTHPNFIFGQLQLASHPLLNEYLVSCLLTLIFAFGLYLITTLYYFVLFKIGKSKLMPTLQQVKEYEQQKITDIKWSIINILIQTPLITFIKLAYPYYTKIQYNWNISYLFPLYVLLHVIYDEFFTYWAHRLLHHPSIYSKLHSIHHQSKAVTPFSGFAFHPIDAFIQALPVFTSCFFIPLPIDLVLAHALITALWAISIHDNVSIIPFKGILYAGSHSIHHFPWGQNYNYGKITTICDRLYGTYCDPQGVSGYGYECPESLKKIINKANQIFEKIIPDNGKERIEKQSRRLAQKKWKLMLSSNKKQ